MMFIIVAIVITIAMWDKMRRMMDYQVELKLEIEKLNSKLDEIQQKLE
jgi:hypothetical protein